MSTEAGKRLLAMLEDEETQEKSSAASANRRAAQEVARIIDDDRGNESGNVVLLQQRREITDEFEKLVVKIMCALLGINVSRLVTFVQKETKEGKDSYLLVVSKKDLRALLMESVRKL